MIDRWRRKRKRGEEKKVGAGGRSEGLFEERGERNYRFKGSWDGVINECGSAVEAVIESLEVSRESRESGWKGGLDRTRKTRLEKTTASQNSKVTTSAIPFYCDCDYLYP